MITKPLEHSCPPGHLKVSCEGPMWPLDICHPPEDSEGEETDFYLFVFSDFLFVCFVCLFVFVFWDRVSLCNSPSCPGTSSCRPGCPGTHRDPPASASWVPGLKVCTITASENRKMLRASVDGGHSRTCMGLCQMGSQCCEKRVEDPNPSPEAIFSW